jgi:hypothetical protein
VVGWVQQFRELLPRFLREELAVDPDLPNVDSSFYLRGPVT